MLPKDNQKRSTLFDFERLFVFKLTKLTLTQNTPSTFWFPFQAVCTVLRSCEILYEKEVDQRLSDERPKSCRYTQWWTVTSFSFVLFFIRSPVFFIRPNKKINIHPKRTVQFFLPEFILNESSIRSSRIYFTSMVCFLQTETEARSRDWQPSAVDFGPQWSERTAIYNKGGPRGQASGRGCRTRKRGTLYEHWLTMRCVKWKHYKTKTKSNRFFESKKLAILVN